MTDHNDQVPAHNDLMPAQEKLEWVTPKISLMEAGGYDGKVRVNREHQPVEDPSTVLPEQLYLKPRHTYKNQSSQRVCKDPF